VRPGDLSREELIALVARIMRAEDDEEEQDRLVEIFQDSVVHPAASDLIYWPDRVPEVPEGRREFTPEEVVDLALAYKPIELGPGGSAGQ
jgi:hypothetical protein